LYDRFFGKTVNLPKKQCNILANCVLVTAHFKVKLLLNALEMHSEVVPVLCSSDNLIFQWSVPYYSKHFIKLYIKLIYCNNWTFKSFSPDFDLL